MISSEKMQHIEAECGVKLFDVLTGYTKDVLKDMGYSYGMPEVERWSKAGLVQMFCMNLPGLFKEMIQKLDFESYQVLKRISNGEDLSGYENLKGMYYLLEMGLLLGDKSMPAVTAVLPKELEEVLKEEDGPEFVAKVKHNSEIYELIDGCILSYGLIDLENLKQIFKKHADFEISDEDFREALSNCEYVRRMIAVEEPLVYSRCFEVEKVSYFIDEQAKFKKFDYKAFTKEELIQASNVDFIPDVPTYWKIISLFKRYFKVSEEMCRISAAVMINYAKCCREFDEAMEYIIMELGYVTGPFMGEFIKLYAEYNNCTGKWALKGYSPNEIMKTLKPAFFEKLLLHSAPEDQDFMGRLLPFQAPEKIGRNSPCPCGSGKKYKYCCGCN